MWFLFSCFCDVLCFVVMCRCLTLFFSRTVRHEFLHGSDDISGFPHCQKHFAPGAGWNMDLGKTAPRPPQGPGAYASGVWFSASRQKPCATNFPPPEIPGPLVGREFGRDARTGTRDACAPQRGFGGGVGVGVGVGSWVSPGRVV